MRDIVRLSPEELNKITSISVEDCTRIIENAKAVAAQQEETQREQEAEASRQALEAAEGPTALVKEEGI